MLCRMTIDTINHEAAPLYDGSVIEGGSLFSGVISVPYTGEANNPIWGGNREKIKNIKQRTTNPQ